MSTPRQIWSQAQSHGLAGLGWLADWLMRKRSANVSGKFWLSRAKSKPVTGAQGFRQSFWTAWQAERHSVAAGECEENMPNATALAQRAAQHIDAVVRHVEERLRLCVDSHGIHSFFEEDRAMAEAAEVPFKDKSVSGDEAEIEDAIRRAGGERQAIRALLVALAETRDAYHSTTSLGFRRGRQPVRRLL